MFVSTVVLVAAGAFLVIGGYAAITDKGQARIASIKAKFKGLFKGPYDL